MRLWKGKIKMLWAILSTLLVGAVAGWLASKKMGGGGSLVRNIAGGVIGAGVGGLLVGRLGFSAHSLFANIIVSVVGACVFLFVARRLTK